MGIWKKSIKIIASFFHNEWEFYLLDKKFFNWGKICDSKRHKFYAFLFADDQNNPFSLSSEGLNRHHKGFNCASIDFILLSWWIHFLGQFQFVKRICKEKKKKQQLLVMMEQTSNSVNKKHELQIMEWNSIQYSLSSRIISLWILKTSRWLEQK